VERDQRGKGRIRMKYLAPLLLLLTLAAYAETPAPHIDFAKWSLLTADVTIRSLDAYSTQRAARCACNREKVLPDFISKHGARQWAYSMLVPAFNYQAAQMLDRRGHHRWSKLVYAVDISLETPAVIGNMQLRDKMPQGMVVLRRGK